LPKKLENGALPSVSTWHFKKVIIF